MITFRRVSQVHGVSLDLVNLRSETYTQDSRIPGAIQFGTPEQVYISFFSFPHRCIDSSLEVLHIYSHQFVDASGMFLLRRTAVCCSLQKGDKAARLAPRSQSSLSQDAMRRDLTINALFYNLDTRSVEDFSGRGLDDLRAGIIRTPLAPRETFMDGELWWRGDKGVQCYDSGLTAAPASGTDCQT